MVRFISREEGVFHADEFDFKNFYMELSLTGKVYGHCHIQVEDRAAYAHLYIDRFGKDVLKEMKADFEQIKAGLRGMGITHIAGSKEVEDCSCWLKFIRLIGFEKVADVVIDGRPAKLAVMEV